MSVRCSVCLATLAGLVWAQNSGPSSTIRFSNVSSTHAPAVTSPAADGNEWPAWSIPSDFNGTAPASGSGPSYASMCNAAYLSWTSAWENYTYSFTNVVATVITVETTEYSYVTLPTQCDGIPRIENLTSATSLVTLDGPAYVTSRSIWSSNRNPDPSTSPVPTCIIDPSDCAGLRSAWTSAASGFSSDILTISLASPPNSIVINGKTTVFDPPMTFPPGPVTSAPVLTIHGQTYSADDDPVEGLVYFLRDATVVDMGEAVIAPGRPVTALWLTMFDTVPYPECATTTRTTFVPQCTIMANNVELMYFAQPSAARDLCANNNPITAFSQSHASTVVDGSTFWSDSVYLKYESVFATMTGTDNQVTTIGGSYSGNVISLASSEVSSMCGWGNVMQTVYQPTNMVTFTYESPTPVPFNFADLVGPVPESAYQCQWQCKYGCYPLTVDEYRPYIAVPSQIRALDPNWANCIGYIGGSYDPPTALGSVSVLVDPTSSSPGPISTASPSVTSPAGTPTPTKPASITKGPDPPASSQASSDPPDPPQSEQNGDPPSSNPPSGDPPSSSSESNQDPGSSPGSDPGPGKTSKDPPTGGTSTPITSATQVTVGSHTVTLDPSRPALITIGDQVVTPTRGMTTVVDGMTIWDNSGTVTMVDGTATMTMQIPASNTGSLGSLIIVGLGGSPTASMPMSTYPANQTSSLEYLPSSATAHGVNNYIWVILLGACIYLVV